MFGRQRRGGGTAQPLGTLRTAQDRARRQSEIRTQQIEKQRKQDEPLRQQIRENVIKAADVTTAFLDHPVIGSALPRGLGLAATTYKNFAPSGSIYHSKDSFGSKMLKYAGNVGLGAVITETLKGLGDATSSAADERMQNLVRRAGPSVPAPRAAPIRVPVPAAPAAAPAPRRFIEPLDSMPPSRAPSRRPSMIPVPPETAYRQAMRMAAIRLGPGR